MIDEAAEGKHEVDTHDVRQEEVACPSRVQSHTHPAHVPAGTFDKTLRRVSA